MSDLTYIVQVSNQPVVVRATPLSSARLQITGGVPGPQGPPGADTVGAIEAAMDTHINDPTPHPSYDDLPSFTLLFENGLV